MSVTREYIAAGIRRVNHVQMRWVEDETFEGGHPGRPGIRIDGHGTSGPGPVETLLGALAACSSIDVVSILEKRRTPVASLVIDVYGVRAEDVPARLTNIQLDFIMTGDGIQRVHAEHAIELAVNKYCSVRDSLDPAIPIEWSLDLNGEKEATDASQQTVEDVP
jgi:putative redox protein